MKTTIQLSLIALAALLFSACAPRIAGNWTVQRYEAITLGQQQGSSFNNIGTMSFDKKGTGEKDISYSVLGAVQQDKSPFEWTSYHNDEYISIKSEGSNLSKTWIVVVNKRKHQIWKSTDGTNIIHVLELVKKKEEKPAPAVENQ